MAKATLVPKEIKVIETVVQPAKVVVELSLHEARLLVALLGKTNDFGDSGFHALYNVIDDTIGKSPSDYRKVMDKVVEESKYVLQTSKFSSEFKRLKAETEKE